MDRSLTVSAAFRERVPERGGSYGEGSSEWWRQEVGIRGMEAAGGFVVVVRRGLAVEVFVSGFVSEKDDGQS